MSEQHDNERFWLMPGEVPIGPFTLPEIHSQLAAGEISWQTKACLVGEGAWRPLIQTPGIGLAHSIPVLSPTPAFPDRKDTPPVNVQSNPVQTSLQKPGESARWETVLGFGILIGLIVIAGLVVYGIYEWCRPLRPKEVCRRLDEAKNVVDAKKYVTLRMYPFIESSYTDPSSINPNDTFEFTNEVDGKLPETKHVGFRGSLMYPEVGERVKMEGCVKLIRQDGWKIDDMFISYIEGAALPAPLSLVDEFQKSKEPLKPTGGTHLPPLTSRQKTVPKVTSIPRQPTRIEKFFTDVYDKIRWGGIGLIVVGIVIYFIRQEAKVKRREKYLR